MANSKKENVISQETLKTLEMASKLGVQQYAHDNEQFKVFILFIEKHGKSYDNEQELSHRYNIFNQTLTQIEIDRKRSPRATYEVNENSDLTQQEFVEKKTCGIRPVPSTDDEGFRNISKRYIDNHPPSFDWREENGVSPVKDQADCNSCYAFATIAAVESLQLIQAKQYVSLSEQQIVSCTLTSENANKGCESGRTDVALKYLKVHGVTSNEEYPYTSGTTKNAGNCEERTTTVGKISGYRRLNGYEDYLASRVYGKGPIIVSIDPSSLQSYTSGIIDTPKPDNGWNITHSVLLVGYGEDNGVEYWIVKNSWGVGFGEQGYFRVIKGGNCLGLAEYPILVTL